MARLRAAPPAPPPSGPGERRASRGSRTGRHAAARAARASLAAKALEAMMRPEFEWLVVEALRLRGYQRVTAEPMVPGADILLMKRQQKFLARCQHWNAYKVGPEAVQEFLGAVAAHQAMGGFIVTAGRFTKDAGNFAKGRPLRLFGGSACLALLQRARWARSQPTPALLSAPTPPGLVPWPSCPVCGAAMIKRRRPVGTRSSLFQWGCTAFPVCRAASGEEFTAP